MFKKIFFVSLSLSLLVFIPQISIANSFSLRSASKTIEPNKTFTLSIYVTPSSTTNIYTTQANISFPADLVSVDSFTYAGSWFPMNQSGYDLIDNTNGKLIKTAGYPSGFNKETLLGTAVFKSKKAGSVSISVNKESFILDMDSNNIIKNFGTFSITSASSALPVTPPVTPPITPPVKTNPVTPKITTPNPVSGGSKVEPKKDPIPEIKTEAKFTENEIKSLLSIDSTKSIIEDVTTILKIIPNHEDISDKDKLKEDIYKLVYQDTNNDGISDYDSKYLYNMDPVKASPVSTYQGKIINAGEKVLLNFNPNKKETERVILEEPINDTKGATVYSYKVTDIDFTEKNEVVIKGQALPNSYSTLYVYSTPIMVTIKTDKNGEWEYTMDKELEDGTHTVYIASVNNMGNIVAKSLPYSFVKTAEAVSLNNILPAEAVGDGEIEEPRFLQTNYLFIIIIGLLILAGIIVTLIGFFSKKKNEEIV